MIPVTLPGVSLMLLSSSFGGAAPFEAFVDKGVNPAVAVFSSSGCGIASSLCSVEVTMVLPVVGDDGDVAAAAAYDFRGSCCSGVGGTKGCDAGKTLSDGSWGLLLNWCFPYSLSMMLHFF